jgi:hypothetical protein
MQFNCTKAVSSSRAAEIDQRHAAAFIFYPPMDATYEPKEGKDWRVNWTFFTHGLLLASGGYSPSLPHALSLFDVTMTVVHSLSGERVPFQSAW